MLVCHCKLLVRKQTHMTMKPVIYTWTVHMNWKSESVKAEYWENKSTPRPLRHQTYVNLLFSHLAWEILPPHLPECEDKLKVSVRNKSADLNHVNLFFYSLTSTYSQSASAASPFSAIKVWRKVCRDSRATVVMSGVTATRPLTRVQVGILCCLQSYGDRTHNGHSFTVAFKLKLQPFKTWTQCAAKDSANKPKERGAVGSCRVRELKWNLQVCTNIWSCQKTEICPNLWIIQEQFKKTAMSHMCWQTGSSISYMDNNRAQKRTTFKMIFNLEITGSSESTWESEVTEDWLVYWCHHVWFYLPAIRKHISCGYGIKVSNLLLEQLNHVPLSWTEN